MTDLRSALGAALGPGYRLERELGGGGMSRVFLAEEVALGRRVVIKALPPDLVASVNAERFRREIQLAAQLQHPGIVPLLSAGAAGELLWYVMPFVEGESLRERLTRGGALPLDEAVRLWRDVLEALEYAHQRGIVHRDIKPENVMLSGRRAVVLDFGVAKAVSAATGTGGANTTGLGVAIGTPAYMAPEQVAGENTADPRLDLYAAGLVMYEMLAGQGPFSATTPRELMAAHVSRAPAPLDTRRAGLPPALVALVMQCLGKEPAERPASATAALQALDGMAAVISGARTPAEGGAALRGGAPTRGRRVAMLVGGVLLAAGAAGVAYWRRSTAELTARQAANLPDSLRLGVLFAPVTHDAADSVLARNLSEAMLATLQTDRRLSPIGETRTVRIAADAGVERRAITRDTIAAIARDMGVHTTLAPSIARVGSGFVLTAEVRSALADSALFRVEVSADNASAVPDALRDIAEQTRRQLAAAQGRIRRPQASGKLLGTTAEAARLWSSALEYWDRRDFRTAATYFREATREDSTFAAAWVQLGAALANAGIHADEQFRASQLAYRYRDRLRLPWGRAICEWDYLSRIGRNEEALRALQAVLPATDGEVINLVRSLIGDTYASLRRPDAAARYYGQIRDTTGANVDGLNVQYVLLLLAAGQPDQARQELERLERIAPQSPATRRARRFHAAITRDFAAARAIAAQELADVQNPSTRTSAQAVLRNVIAAMGQLDSADALDRARNRFFTESGDTASILITQANAAVRRAELLGDTTAVRPVAEALRDGRWQRLAPLDRPYLPVIRAFLAAGRVADAKQLLEEWRTAMPPEIARVQGWTMAQARGELLLAERKPAEALKAFQAGDSVACVACMYPYYALAHDQAGRRDSAIVWYERYVTANWAGLTGVVHPRFLARAYRRLGELHEEAGRPKEALQRYGDFAALWKDADPALQPAVQDARKRIERLSAQAR